MRTVPRGLLAYQSFRWSNQARGGAGVTEENPRFLIVRDAARSARCADLPRGFAVELDEVASFVDEPLDDRVFSGGEVLTLGRF
jgi:hypothetical protein